MAKPTNHDTRSHDHDGATTEPPATQALLVNIPTAAKMLSLSRSTIYELMWQGELVPIHIGRSVRLPMDELEAFVDRQTTKAERQMP